MRNIWIAAIGMATAGLVSTAPALALDGVTTYAATAPFEEVSSDLNDAIVNRGYVVDYHGFIGDMLDRTAGDVGSATKLYNGAEIYQFCSAVLSRKAMEADIANIAFCPYVLFVYEDAAMPGTVTVGFRRLPAGEGRDEVDAVLDGIAREAAGK